MPPFLRSSVLRTVHARNPTFAIGSGPIGFLAPGAHPTGPNLALLRVPSPVIERGFMPTIPSNGTRNGNWLKLGVPHAAFLAALLIIGCGGGGGGGGSTGGGSTGGGSTGGGSTGGGSTGGGSTGGGSTGGGSNRRRLDRRRHWQRRLHSDQSGYPMLYSMPVTGGAGTPIDTGFLDPTGAAVTGPATR